MSLYFDSQIKTILLFVSKYLQIYNNRSLKLSTICPSIIQLPGRTPFGAYLIVLPVRIRIHWGIDRFCFSFFAKWRLIRNVLWAAYNEMEEHLLVGGRGAIL